MSNIKLLMVTFLILLFGLGFGVACSSGNTPSPNIKPTESDVRNFADSMVENMLQAMNTADYAQYTRDFDEDFKNNLPSASFERVNSLRIETIGKYVSKEYWKMVQKDEKITVGYRATFEGTEGTVFVTVYFKNINERWYIDGTYFDSLLLHASGC
jgi:hypothetical protein